LLYHGIKPVFVFDGDAPTLKKRTIVRNSVLGRWRAETEGMNEPNRLSERSARPGLLEI
jgi:5'-3' exonuclease